MKQLPDSPTAPTVVFEDTNLLVIDKPAGLLSQGDITGEPHLIDWARDYVGRHYVGLIHRLDRNTSGLMVLAKRSKAADRLSEALRDGRLERRYQAWCLGELKPGEPARWRHFLFKDESTNQSRVVAASAPGAQEAILHARAIESRQVGAQTVTLIEFVLETGRSHQIRVQCAAMGLPILGDPRYGTPASARLAARTALHSCYLRFPHPIGGAELEFKSSLPAELALRHNLG